MKSSKGNSKRLDFLPNIQNKYSIRKFTVGTASILVGATLVFGVNNDAHAEEMPSQLNPTESTVATTADEPSSQNQSVTTETPTSQPTSEQTNNETTIEENTSAVEENTNHVDTPASTDNENVTKETQPQQEANTTQAEPPKENATSQETETSQAIDKTQATEAPKETTQFKSTPGTTTAQLGSISEADIDSLEAPKTFVDLYNTSANREELVRNLLGDTYGEADVENILKNVNVDYNNASAEEAFKAVIYAGLQHAKDQQSIFTSYAIINGKEAETLDEFEEAIYLDPNKGLTAKGTGKTAVSQKPTNYTVTAVPNRANNTVDFTVNWKVDKTATESGHEADIGGLKFGTGFNVPSSITGTAIVTGGKTTQQTNRVLAPATRTSYPEGYALISPIAINKQQLQNNGDITYKFSIPVKDWNGDLSFNGQVMMYTSGNNNYDPATFDNYYYETGLFIGDNHPENHLVTKDDASEVENIPFQTDYTISKDIPLGEQKVVKEGKDGKRGKLYTVISFNGKEVGRVLKDTYDEAPTNRVVALGIGGMNDSNIEGPIAPVLEPQLSGSKVISGETSPNAQVEIKVGDKTYTTQADETGRFTTTLPDYTLQQGDIVTATSTVDGKTSQPGKVIVPRDGRTPSIKTDVQRGVDDSNNPGSWVTITNEETGEQISRFFVPDGAAGKDGQSVTITNDYVDPKTGDTVIKFSDGRTIRIPKGEKGESGENGVDGQDGQSITITSTSVDPDGNTIVRFSDGTEIKIPAGQKGEQGEAGPQGEKGESIRVDHTDVDPETGDTTVTFTDGSTVKIPAGKDGKDGQSIGIKEIVPLENGDQRVVFTDGKEMVIPKGAQGEKGDKGEDGTSITIEKTETLENGDTKVTFSDGSSITIPKGQDGANGQDGQSITIKNTETLENGDTKVTFSDGTSITIPKGKDGANGQDGKDGTSITIENTETLENGDTKVTFSDGSSITIPKGKDGVNGQDGQSITIDKTETLENGDTKVTFSDGSSITIPKGEKGDKGEDGKDGASITIESITPNEDGSTTIEFSDGKTMDVPAGKDGESITIKETKVDPETGDTTVVFSDGKEIVIPKGKDGVNGQDGQSITVKNTETLENGDTKVTFSDGSSITIPKGEKGDKGEDGTSITIDKTETLDNGDTKVTFSDGSSITIPKGEDGVDGQDGQSITIDKTETLENGDTKVTFSDGSSITIPKGEKGDKGEDGQDGTS
ncbi:YSIRK-type signal peptide-containing protein, partial [Staphylococcus microti]